MKGFFGGLTGVLVGICIYEAGNRRGYKRFVKLLEDTLDIIERKEKYRCECEKCNKEKGDK